MQTFNMIEKANTSNTVACFKSWRQGMSTWNPLEAQNSQSGQYHFEASEGNNKSIREENVPFVSLSDLTMTRANAKISNEDLSQDLQCIFHA